jgi:hypothetical protein
MGFLTGEPGKIQQISTLRPDQEVLSHQLVNAGRGRGAGGGFGQSADYYRDLLSDNPADMQAFNAQAMRQFNEDIIPGISEQFAGMGAGGLSSSGFRNSANQAGVDLSERLASIRANLRQAGAQGLQNIGQLGLQNFQQNHETPGTEGFLSSIAPALGGAIGTAVAGPLGGAIGGGLGSLGSSWFGGKGNQVGANSSPYGGGGPQGSPQISSSSKGSLPNFMQRTEVRGY